MIGMKVSGVGERVYYCKVRRNLGRISFGYVRIKFLKIENKKNNEASVWNIFSVDEK